jgi:predicted Zn-dependent peptidase
MKRSLWIALACLGSLAALATAAWTKLERSKRPPIGPPPAVATPKIARRTLTNGLQVWIVTRRELPIVNASLLIRAGSCQDGDRAGLAAMTASLLDEGTASRPAVAFANAVEDLGATLSAAASEEQTTVALQTLTRHLDEALGLMGEMVVQPTFSAEELERERKSRLQSLKQQRDQPGAVATRVFNQVVYGESHPYGRPAAGTAESVEEITRDQIVDFHRRYYRPNNAVLIVVGDVSDAELVPRLERAFAGWTQSPISDDAAAIPARPPDRPIAVTLIDKPGAAQSEIRVGHAGAARTTSPDYYALQVLNALLGGQFNSRINLNLREAKGYTYGARSSLGFRRGDGPFVASAGVFTAKTDSSLIEFPRELEDIRAAARDPGGDGAGQEPVDPLLPAATRDQRRGRHGADGARALRIAGCGDHRLPDPHRPGDPAGGDPGRRAIHRSRPPRDRGGGRPGQDPARHRGVAPGPGERAGRGRQGGDAVGEAGRERHGGRKRSPVVVPLKVVGSTVLLPVRAQ